METINLKTSFKEGSWKKREPPDVLFLEPMTTSMGREVADTLEEYLKTNGISHSGSKDMAHYNLVGVDAWRIDFRNRTFQQIEAFEMLFEGYDTDRDRIYSVGRCSFEQLEYFLGLAETLGKKFGL